MPANDLKTLKDQDEQTANERVREAHQKQYRFKILIRHDNYNGERRLRIQASQAYPLKFVEDSKEIIGLLEKYSLNDPK